VRSVLETNVLLSGLLWRGAPHEGLEQVRAGRTDLVSSPALIAELARIATRAKFRTVLSRSATDPDRSLAEVRMMAEIIDPPPLPVPISRDPDDDAVLAVAVAARVDMIASGDGDLPALGRFAGISIVKPAQAVILLGSRRIAGVCETGDDNGRGRSFSA
jgi:putative PIN family toxin of toxin-antitoxin system